MKGWKYVCLCAAMSMLALPPSGVALAQDVNHKHYDVGHGYMQRGLDGSLAPRLQNLGNHRFPVTTQSERAQLFMNQGVNLAYGFNHAESGRAFTEAARLDPDCAMAYWGQALVLGPNINAPMDPAAEAQAHELIQKAQALRNKVTERERAYIEALAKRYTGRAEDRKAADRAYSDAMRAVHRDFPDDLDAAAIFAESLMDLRPWDYWMPDGAPYPGTEEIASTLKSIMEKNPDHPGALHFWIHLWEPTKTPEKAEQAADRLASLVPGAGHLVHMPSHVYMRVGRYQDAVEANVRAIAADEDYISQCRVQGFYPVSYYPHNIHFLWFAETERGREQAALEAARKVAEKMSPEVLRGAPMLQFFAAVPYQALVRFERWDEIMSGPRPGYDGPMVVGMWHFARGMALNAKGQAERASEELTALRKMAEDPELKKLMLWSPNSVGSLLAIGVQVLAGEIAAGKVDFQTAIAHLDRAVRLEDGLAYIEPPDWGLPTRQVLGKTLLKAGRAAEAETVYWEDLQRQPDNGWALSGLLRALRAQGKDEQAAAIETRLRDKLVPGSIFTF